MIKLIFFSNGELYIIVFNKPLKDAEELSWPWSRAHMEYIWLTVSNCLPESLRYPVKEMNLDMVANTQLAIKRSFPKAKLPITTMCWLLRSCISCRTSSACGLESLGCKLGQKAFSLKQLFYIFLSKYDKMSVGRSRRMRVASIRI